MREVWLSDTEQKTWRNYLRMSDQLRSHLDRQLQSSTSMSISDYSVLVNLSESPNHRARSFHLAEVLQWERSRLSHHLTRMEKRGLVAREDCSTDGRGAVVAITENGLAAIKSAAPFHVRQVRDAIIDVLSEEQRRMLDEITLTVLTRLDDLSAAS